MADFFGHSKVIVKKVQLTSLNSNKSINVYKIMQQLEIFGSIFDPHMIGTITLNDGSSLIQTLPIIGEEILEVEFETPGRKTFSKVMHVYNITDMNYNPNGTHIGYRLHFVSVDYYSGAKNNISKSLRGNISDMVTSLLRSDIGSPQKIYSESTSGIEHIVIPSWTCWDVIEFLRKRAVSPTYHSPYIFFEDMKGYHFKTYEKLIEERKGNIADLTFTADSFLPGAGEDKGKTAVLSKQYRNVQDLTIDNKANTAKLLNKGGVSARVTVFDIMDKSVKTVDVTIDDAKKLVKAPLDKKFNPTHSSKFNQTTKPTLQYMMPYNQSQQSLAPEQLTRKNLYAQMLEETVISFTTNGDSQIQPGDIIKFIMPSRVQNNKPDSQLSGNYIIGNLRHGISSDEMYTTIEAFKIGSQDRIV